MSPAGRPREPEALSTVELPAHGPSAAPPGSAPLGSALPRVIRFQVLGPLRVVVDGTRYEAGPPQQQAVLSALLLRQGHALSVAALVEAVWGARAPARAVGALRTYVSGLRGLLEPERPSRTPARVLVSTPAGYRLRLAPGSGTEVLDAALFEQWLGQSAVARRAGLLSRARRLLTSALGLWHGEALADVPGPGAAAHRLRLGERRMTAFESRWETELDLGGHHRAIAPLSAASLAHPVRERLQELLITALCRAGQRAEALDVYARTRHALATELGVEPGPHLVRLRRRLVPGPPDRPVRRGPTAPTAPASTAPARAVPSCLVPPAHPPADFTGRTHETAVLCAALTDRRAVSVGTVSGMSGVGKTAFALHVAHRVRDRFPDGVFFADLLGHCRDPVRPGPMLAELLRTLGVEAPAVPAATGERAALYRSLLADRDVLLVLDNARDAAHIRHLLPGGPGCAVLATGRSRLAGLPGTTSVELLPLPAPDAMTLLGRIVGEHRVRAEERAAARLLGVCGHLPLAIRVIGTRIAARPGRPIAPTAAALADEGRRLAELAWDTTAVPASFGQGVTLLDAEHVRAFRLLARSDAPELSLSDAAVLLERSEPDAECLCEALVDLSLLESVAPGRYRFHDLLRLYGRYMRDGPVAVRPPGENHP